MKRQILSLIFFSCMLLFLQPLQVQAQNRQISGTVRDATTNDPLPGVTVLIKGTSTGTTTNLDGAYNVSGGTNDVLVFSFVGYIDQEVAIGNRSIIDVDLQEDIQELSEVIVVGYGTQEKKDATGAVAVIDAKEFNQGIISSPEELIQGKTAGVQITQASGEPGAGVNIRIRGTSSVRGGNNPLFVVDGVPLAGDDVSSGGQNIGRGTSSARNPLNFLNPNDIASVNILKDASATAIYGSRGANGVVLITTKSGTGIKKRLEYGSQVSVGQPANTFDLLDRNQYLDAIREYGGEPEDLNADTDWQDVIFRNAVSHKHDLSFANGYGSGNYRVSLGYQNQQGIVENSGLERLTARLNWNQSFFNDKLDLGIQSTISRLNDEQAPITDNAGFEGDLLGVTYSGNPTWPADPTVQPSNTVANPSALLAFYQDNTETNRALVNASLQYEITSNFNVKVNGGYDNSGSSRGALYSPELGIGSGIAGNGRGFIGEVDATNQLFETLLNYEKEFDNSSLTALGGYSYQRFERNGTNIFGWGFQGTDMDAMINDLYTSSDLIRGAINQPYQQFGYHEGGFFINTLFPEVATVQLSDQVNSEVRSVAGDIYGNVDELQSYFGRVNYNLQDKYLFTATLRADGSTRFGGNNKYGYFPSGAFAWRLSDEDFVPDLFYDLKFRLGYGVTGNQEIPHNLYQQRIRYSGIGIADDGNIQVPGTNNVAFNNPDLQWEETSQSNIGLDFSFGNGRIGGSLDLYRKVTTDLLIRVNSAQPAPQPFVFRNLNANVINQGIELMLNFIAVETDDVGIDFNLNGSINDNRVEDYDGPPIDTGGINGQGLTGAFAQRIADGQPLYAFYLREFTGINDEGQSEYVVDAQQFVGKSPLPKYNLGFNATFRYKQWDLAAFGYGQFGHYIYNNTANAFFTLGSIGSGRNITENALEFARETGESIANTPDASTRFLESGDFFRLQNLNLGYTAPIQQGFFSTFRVFASLQNLFVITDYSGLDPEVNVNKSLNGVPSAGIDYTSYPRARTYSLGLNVSF